MEPNRILSHFQGNKSNAALALGVSRPTLYKWLGEPTLPEEAMMRMRDWFLREKGEIPKAWMPK